MPFTRQSISLFLSFFNFLKVFGSSVWKSQSSLPKRHLVILNSPLRWSPARNGTEVGGGEGSESSCWKQSWLGGGFLIPLLHTGNAGAVSVSGAVPQKAKYPTASWTIHIAVSPCSRIPSAGAAIYTTGGAVSCSRAASSTYLSAAPPSPPPQPHASNLGTHWKPCHVSLLIWIQGASIVFPAWCAGYFFWKAD